MAYYLLTGATGLLGRYLLRDLTLAELPLAVVVRATRWESATQRIETAMAHWENELGRALVRPVVLEGDISEPCLGLCERDLEWVGAHCGTMIHSAASLTFHAEEPTGEPFRSNLQGTRNVLELCRRAQIRHFHHVSTAYVCGLRRGRILETELDVGQEPGNDYERTKIAAEKEVLASRDLEQVTVYRPSIIVGDSATGFTTSYHGFYTPLRLVYSLLQTVPWETILQRDWLGQLQLDGGERKNLVAVDWVSAALTWLVSNPQYHGQTYHLTNPTPATTLSMREAMTEVLDVLARGKRPTRASGAADEDFMTAFREQMKVYQSYWSDDPEFDSTHTQTAAPHLPCPEIDHEVMNRLVRFATGTNFGWPRETPIVPPYEVASVLRPWLEANAHTPQTNGQARHVSVNLHVSGPGGGQWHVVMDQGRVVRAGVGLLNGAGSTCYLTCYLTSATFAALVRGDVTLDNSMNTGRLVIVGTSVHARELARFFCDLASADKTSVFQKAMIR
jgi:thioester reductase-like protein